MWTWTGYFDPGQTLDNFTTSQMGSENEPYWSNTQFDKLAVAQASAVDPAQRQKIIWRMQQIMYRQAPWIVLTYPRNLQAVNTAKWTGWTREFNGTGGAWGLEGNIASYLNLRPRAATTSSAGGSRIALIVIVVAVIAAAALGAVLVVRRSRRRAEVEV